MSLITAASVERLLSRPHPSRCRVELVTVTEGDRDDYGEPTETTSSRTVTGRWAPKQYREDPAWQDATLDLYLPVCVTADGRMRARIVTGPMAGLYEVVAVENWGVGQVVGVRRAT